MGFLLLNIVIYLGISSPSSRKLVVDCHKVYAIKVGPYGQIDRLKVRLVDKRYSQI